MADHNKPVLTSTYANFVSELDARFDDLSVGLDPAVTTATNLPVGSIRWNSVLSKDQKWNGSTWSDKSSFYVLGSVRFNNGTVGSPSITFSGDTTTGIFKPTATSIAISIMGVEALRAENGDVYVNDVDVTGTATATRFTGSRFYNTLTGSAEVNARNHFTAYNAASIPITSGWISAAFGDSTGNRVVIGSAGSKAIVGGHNGDLSDWATLVLAGEQFQWTTDGRDSGTMMLLNSNGNLLLGTTVDDGSKLRVTGLTHHDGPTYLAGLLTADARTIAAGAYGTDFEQSCLEIRGGGSLAPTVHPTIGFHNPEVFAGTLRQYSATDFGFYRQGGVIPADLTVGKLKGVAERSDNLVVNDPVDFGNPRDLSHITPQSSPRSIRAEFATGVGTGSIYSGVITFSPYSGTTASTGGPGYQLAFGSSQNNGGTPQLRLRNGIDTTWNSWVDVMTPAGAILHFARSTAPSGYLKANGAAVSRTAYQALFDAIGTTFGAGDGSTTFNLPDLRGEFIRGWDDGRGTDTGRGFGSFQTGSVESHAHLTDGTLAGDRTVVWNRGVDGAFDASSQTATGNDADYRIGSKTGTYGETETRPRNIALLACIKF